MKSFIRNYRVSVPIAAILLVGLAWLAFGYFGVHTLFIDEEVSEAVPTFDAPAVEADAAAASTPGTVPVITEQPESATPAADDETVPTTEPAAEPVAEADTPETPAAEPTIVTEYSGAFESDAHPTSGEAVVLGNGTGQRFLRFEGFETDNGPDLNVYLVNSSTGDVSDYVDLGDLKGNIGEQNYEIPVDVDLDVYDQVVIWCVRFGVGFGDAELMNVA